MCDQINIYKHDNSMCTWPSEITLKYALKATAPPYKINFNSVKAAFKDIFNHIDHFVGGKVQ